MNQSAGLADGEWHRLHPATPLLRGGLYLVAMIGIVIANLRERLVEWFLPQIACPAGDGRCEPDPFSRLIESGFFVTALLIALGVLLLLVALFYVSWRMHTFRVTDEVVEVRSGVLFRTHRKARLDRIQGVSVSRPLFARLFGAAKLDVEVAGQDANVQLSYLGNATADQVRADILRLASGSRAAAAAASGAEAPAASLVERRVSELLAPELDPTIAPPESVVRVPASRLVGSTLLSGSSMWLIVLAAVTITVVVLALTVTPALLWTLFTILPITIGFGSYLVSRVFKFLRYTIAATPDGVRIGYGLLSTRNETLPPGRIHSVSVSQNLVWRPADWWTVRVNRASRTTSASSNGQAQQQNNIVLPVGTRDDVFKVLELLLPELLGVEASQSGDLRALLDNGLTGKGGQDDFTTSPRRAAVLRWFSWRRNGFALFTGVALLRRGAIWRELVIVPTPRIQSVAVQQGPLNRSLRLARVHLHTVAGPIFSYVGAIDADDAQAFFRDAATAAVAAARADRTHRWRSGEA